MISILLTIISLQSFHTSGLQIASVQIRNTVESFSFDQPVSQQYQKTLYNDLVT